MILGIDLGTTNSSAAIIKDGKPEFVDFDGSELLPSVVGFTNEGELLIGRPAKNQSYLYPHNTVKSIKRKMGETEPINLNNKDYLPEEISAIILRYIKEQAEKQFGRKIQEAIISVPAYFSDDQRNATRVAGSIAGFEVKRIINEPTAAALTSNHDSTESARALVYDLGGGTFDVSLVNIDKSIVEVIASHGNNHLGGDDFDQILLEHVLEIIESKYGENLQENIHATAQLTHAVENAKIELSSRPFAKIIENIDLPKSKKLLNIELELSINTFESLIEKFLQETMESIHIAMRDANLHSTDIEQILLVGGSSKIPLVSSNLEELFKMRPEMSINPDLSVCAGAAIQGAIMEDANIDSILIDVTPFTFGIETRDRNWEDIFAPIIHRNTPLPVSKTKLFYKMHPDQETVLFNVYQGENPKPKLNKLIGKFKIEDLTSGVENEELVTTMNLDINGILHVTGMEKNTGLQKDITIENAFVHDDIAGSVGKIVSLFGSDDELPDNETNEFESDQKDEKHIYYVAKTMIEKALSKIDDAAPDDADEMENYIKLIKENIENQNTDKVKDYLDELTDILFYID